MPSDLHLSNLLALNTLNLNIHIARPSHRRSRPTMRTHLERPLQQEICAHLAAHGWQHSPHLRRLRPRKRALPAGPFHLVRNQRPRSLPLPGKPRRTRIRPSRRARTHHHRPHQKAQPARRKRRWHPQHPPQRLPCTRCPPRLQAPSTPSPRQPQPRSRQALPGQYPARCRRSPLRPPQPAQPHRPRPLC